jgi:hypothetical protein
MFLRASDPPDERHGLSSAHTVVDRCGTFESVDIAIGER